MAALVKHLLKELNKKRIDAIFGGNFMKDLASSDNGDKFDIHQHTDLG